MSWVTNEDLQLLYNKAVAWGANAENLESESSTRRFIVDEIQSLGLGKIVKCVA